MLVKIRYSGETDDPGPEYEHSCDVLVDGEEIAAGYNMADCPEDANLGRELAFVFGLPDVLRRAYEAGKRGEPFSIERVPHS